jgi:hypothetical protein
MTRVLASPWFHVVAVPLCLMLVGVLARRLGRRDGDPSPRLNDWSVGTLILLTALGKVAGDFGGAHDPLETFAWFVGILVFLFFSINHDRYNSWARDAAGVPTNEKRLVIGILIPDVATLVVFAAYQFMKTP